MFRAEVDELLHTNSHASCTRITVTPDSSCGRIRIWTLKTAISCSIVKTQQNRQNLNPYTFEASIIACLRVRVWNLLEPEPLSPNLSRFWWSLPQIWCRNPTGVYRPLKLFLYWSKLIAFRRSFTEFEQVLAIWPQIWHNSDRSFEYRRFYDRITPFWEAMIQFEIEMMHLMAECTQFCSLVI